MVCGNEDYATKSSNFRELANLVLLLKTGLADGTIPEGSEAFIFTDNFVAECTYHRGNSKSRTLFDLMLEIRELQMSGKMFIHIIWVAGTRMIAQGTDGASRGDLSNGVVAGLPMLDYVPLNRGVDVRSPGLITWMIETFGEASLQPLTPAGWFHLAHTTANFLWAPPPAAADVALEQLCESRHVRPWNAHVFLCPALMTVRWRKRLGKVADVMFTIPVGSRLWGSEMHEPVIVALIFPLLVCSPWQVRRATFVDGFKSRLRQMWSADLARERTHLRELWRSAAQIGFVQPGVAC